MWPAGVAEDIGRQLLVYGRRIPKAELFARIDAVDEEAVKDVASRFIYDQELALAAVGDCQNLPDYNWFRRRTCVHPPSMTEKGLPCGSGLHQGAVVLDLPPVRPYTPVEALTETFPDCCSLLACLTISTSFLVAEANNVMGSCALFTISICCAGSG